MGQPDRFVAKGWQAEGLSQQAEIPVGAPGERPVLLVQSGGGSTPRLPAAGEGGYAAGLKKYNLSEEVGMPSPGALAVEVDGVYLHQLKTEHGFSQYVISPQIGYGVSDRLAITILPGDSNYVSSRDREGLAYDTSGIQAYYGMKDIADEDGFGWGFFGSAVVGPQRFSAEVRWLAGWDVGPWNFTYNIRLQNDLGAIDGGGTEHVGTLGHTFGVSYTWKPEKIFHEMVVGFEATVDTSWSEFRHYDGTLVYVGPSVGATFLEHWTVLVSAARQATDIDGAARWQIITAVIYSF